MPSRAAPARPLVPSDINPSRSLMRAAFAVFRAEVEHGDARDVVAALYPADRAALAVVELAAVSGARTTVSGWASQLVSRGTAEFLTSLPRSAASQLIQQGASVSLIDTGPQDVPILASPVAVAPWIGEGGAIPVNAFSFGTVPLDGKKLGIIVALSRELARYSNAEQIFDALLREVAALSLDAAYFSTSAGSTSAHEGLLHNVTPLTGSTDMMADLRKLAAAVSGPGSSGQVTFISGAGRAAAAALDANVNTTILASPAVPADRVIAVDPLSLTHGHDGSPEITTSIDATIHMSDSPTDIGIPGSPPTIAAPTINLLQVGMVSLRLLVDIGFVKRRSDCCAYLDGATW